MHVHINPIGGIAGDMFIAAVLDMSPDLKKPMLQTLKKLSQIESVHVALEEHRDSVFRGKSFQVKNLGEANFRSSFCEIHKILSNSGFRLGHRVRSCQILKELAMAESVVHGVELQNVHLHEAGSPDSIVDIICAGFLIDKLRDMSWTCDSLPMGKGTAQTHHGEIPLPGPAVAQLLIGAPVHDDGRIGERVTPTGAAILKVLQPKFNNRRSPMKLKGAGIGFGTQRFEGMSNILRLLAFESLEEDLELEKVALIQFEVDDQSPEDLGIGLAKLRNMQSVLDVIQIPALGKKGRMTIHVQVLANTEFLHEIASACIYQTSTLGVRWQIINRYIVERSSLMYRDSTREVPIKIARRGSGNMTAKVESDYLTQVGDYTERKRTKQELELSIERSPEESPKNFEEIQS